MAIEASSASSPVEIRPIISATSTTPQSSSIVSSDLPVRIADSNSNSESVNYPGVSGKKSSLRMRKKSKVLVSGVHPLTKSSASAVGERGLIMRLKPRIGMDSNSRQRIEIDALGLPLGMSIAAVFAQVLDKKEEIVEAAYIDNLSEMCTSALKEALDNVFGDECESFVGNFEKSFRSTLKTVRLVNKSSMTKGRYYQSRQKMIGTSRMTEAEPIPDADSSITRKSTYRGKDNTSEITLSSDDESNDYRHLPRNFNNLELDFRRETRHDLVCTSLIRTSSAIDSSMVRTFNKSVAEQTRANDLKAYELSLQMENLKLKEMKLALDSESNFLDRLKLSMGFSRASFKAEKFKTELEETRHAELLRNCIDILVGSLFITSGSLIYGAYVHSYNRIIEATASCTPSETSKSWWVPKPVDAFSSGFQMISCQVQVLTRMIFGILMIVTVAYLFLQRSAAPGHSMPITFILLMLGGACGFFGKFCVDTLGGDGYIWLLFWETMCSIHFMANCFTSSLFTLLYGPINFNLSIKNSASWYYFFSRRVIFYAITLFILPFTCGLVPFATTDEWKDHFSALVTNAFIS
ncbi:unnamed protein product [Rhodiola kirilowii]